MENISRFLFGTRHWANAEIWRVVWARPTLRAMLWIGMGSGKWEANTTRPTNVGNSIAMAMVSYTYVYAPNEAYLFFFGSFEMKIWNWKSMGGLCNKPFYKFREAYASVTPTFSFISSILLIFFSFSLIFSFINIMHIYLLSKANSLPLHWITGSLTINNIRVYKWIGRGVTKMSANVDIRCISLHESHSEIPRKLLLLFDPLPKGHIS